MEELWGTEANAEGWGAARMMLWGSGNGERTAGHVCMDTGAATRLREAIVNARRISEAKKAWRIGVGMMVRTREWVKRCGGLVWCTRVWDS